MGTLRVNNLGENTGSTQETLAGQAKAWINVDLSGSSILSSFNVSSYTDNGTGDFDTNLTASMNDGNYAITGAAGDGAGQTAARRIGPAQADPTASDFRSVTDEGAGTPQDVTYNCAAVLGDLA